MQLLLVEDDVETREVLAEFLGDKGHQVTAVADAMDAIRWLSRADSERCVVILDLRLPRMTGLEFLTNVREARPELLRRIIVASASPDMLRAVRDEVAARFTKPFDLEELLKAVERAGAPAK